jgi:hypothetical protein
MRSATAAPDALPGLTLWNSVNFSQSWLAAQVGGEAALARPPERDLLARRHVEPAGRSRHLRPQQVGSIGA